MAPDLPLTLDQFLDYLDIGEYDDRLTEIIDRADERHTVVLNRRSRELKVGEQLRFNDTTSPKYLRGKTVTYGGLDEELSKKRGQPWVFVLAPPIASYRRFAGSTFRAPVNTLEKVEP